MKETPPPNVLIDANILYSASLRNLFLFIASIGLYNPKWSVEINAEWTRNLLLKRSDLSRKAVLGKVDRMNIHFQGANVTDYSELISTLYLPDPDDRHVLAAAIKGKAKIITTANLQDFPQDYIRQFNIEIQHPDDFIMDLLNDFPEEVLFAFKSQVENLKNPPLSEEDVLLSLGKNGLVKTVFKLRTMLK